MKTHLFILILLIFSTISYAQNYQGPIAQPTSGYAVPGTHTVDTMEFTHSLYSLQKSVIYYPSDTSGSFATVFFLHGFNGQFLVLYDLLFRFIASQGYNVVFAPYPPSFDVQNNYDIMETAFLHAARNYSIIDTTKVGLIGYSFGGGAAIYMASKLYTKLDWGVQGRFIATVCPWYSFFIDQAEVAALPFDTRMLSFVNSYDNVCDHRMAMEMYYNTTSIAPSQKDVVYVSEDTVGNYTYFSDHFSFTTFFINNYDAMDVYVYHRLIGALMAYTFAADLSAYSVALGSGSADQITMPAGMKDLEVVDFPAPKLDQNYYQFPCDSAINPRSAFCVYLTDVMPVDEDLISVATRPEGYLIKAPPSCLGQKFQIFDATGRLLDEGTIQQEETQITTTSLAPSLYILKFQGKGYPLIVF